MRSVLALLGTATSAILFTSPAMADCTEVYAYVPPVYTGVSAGDAILFPSTGGSDGITQLFQAINLKYTHVALAYDDSGASLAESQWDTVPPPSTSSTGGDHACSRILDSGRLQRLNPGTTGTGISDPSHTLNSAVVIQQMGNGFCNSAPDTYHFNSFIHDDVNGGSCEKYVVDYCGVPVQEGDKVVIQGSQLNAGLMAVYGYAYNGALGITSGLPWYDYAFCGGVDATIMSQRAAMQVTNEIRWKWWELQQPDGNSTDYLGIDTNAEGIYVTAPGGYQVWENLGGGSQNTQWTGPGYDSWDYCTNVNISNQTPGGVLQGEGADCPSWNNYGNSLTVNVPDDVENANNNHVGHLEYQANVSPGYWYDTGQVQCTDPSPCGSNGICMESN